MSDTEVERYEEGDEEVEEGRSQIRRMPDDDLEKGLTGGEGVGPFFPSGMSAPEAALAGAPGASPEVVARMRGEHLAEDEDDLDDEDEPV